MDTTETGGPLAETPGTPPEPSADDFRLRRLEWPTRFAVRALFGNARFVGEVWVERIGDEVTVSGKRVGYWPYWVRFWLIVLLIGLLALPPVQELGPVAVVNIASVLLLVTVGGRVLLHGTATHDQVAFRVSKATDATVGLRIRGLHLMLVGFSGLAALVVFALYRGGRRTVSVYADRGDGDPVRYLFMARDAEQAIQLAAMLLP